MTIAVEQALVDPPREARCAGPGCKKRPVGIPAKPRYGRPQDFAADPFCSRLCCQAYHGLSPDLPPPRRRRTR